MEEKTSFWPQLGPVRHEFGAQLFLKVSALLDVRHHSCLKHISNKGNTS